MSASIEETVTDDDEQKDTAAPARNIDDILSRTPIADAYMICLWGNRYTGDTSLEMEEVFNLNRDDCNVVLSLGSFGPLSASDICLINGRPKNSISRAVSRVSERRLVSKLSIVADRRRTELSLTASGQAMYGKMIPMFVDKQDRMLGALSVSERQVLGQIFRKILKL